VRFAVYSRGCLLLTTFCKQETAWCKGKIEEADRRNNRIQVFRKDGTFVGESFIALQTLWWGSVWDIELSPDANQTYMYIADEMNMKVWILNRSTLKVVGSFGNGGRNAG
jgi:hypothetical protein